LQSDLAALMADLANSCGPARAKALAAKFPGMFERC